MANNTRKHDLLADPTHIPGWYEGVERGGDVAPAEGFDPVTEDEITSWVNKAGWEEWDGAYRGWERQIEENVRMVAGRQYDAYIPELGEFLDISEWVLAKDEQWRQYPTFNWIAHYYKLTLSKLTENLPGIGFVPAGSDWEDAQLARIMEPVWKHQWHQMEMPEHMFTLYAWVIIAARAISKLRWDPDAGPREERRGNAAIKTLEGNAITGRVLTDAPYIRGPNGELKPNIIVDSDGNPIMGDDGQPETGPADTDFMGDLAFDVVVPSSVRTPHNSAPFHRKAWYTHEYLMPVDEIERRFGVRVEPADMAGSSSLFLKLAYGENYGMPSSWMDSLGLGNVEDVAMRGMAPVREHWRAQVPGHPILDKGRLTIVSQDTALYDDVNPFWTETHRQAVILFDAFDAVPVPFRNEGMGDLEILNPIQKAMNRREAAMQDAVDHAEQPTTFYNENTIDEIDVDKFNQPGETIGANLIPGVGPPAFRLDAAGLPDGSFQLAEHMMDFLRLFGSLPQGAEGVAATADASGELQREVRFDTDRVWGTTLRLHSYVWSRISLKMGHIMSACLTDDRLVVLAGEDMAAEFVMIGPEMFTGRINAIPQPESQVLESRQEKQNRLMQLVSFGAILPEVAVQALNYPDLNRALRPGAGGPAFSMAQRENLEMLLGQLSPVLPRHAHDVHMAVHIESMQSPSYRDLPPEIQQLFELHVFMHEQFLQAQLEAALQQQALAQETLAPEEGQGGNPAGGSTEGAPSGEEQQRGATQPGAADPRNARLSLTG